MSLTPDLLVGLELFYETLSYDVHDICESNHVSTMDFVDFVYSYIDSRVPLFGNITDEEYVVARRKIHEKMDEFNVVTRETKISTLIHEEFDEGEQLFEFIDGDNCFKVNKKRVIEILFPDPEIRRKEIYTTSVNLATNCNDVVKNDLGLKHPADIYEGLGFFDAYDGDFDDLLMDVVKKNPLFRGGRVRVHAVFLKMAVVQLILTQLNLVLEYDDEDELVSMIVDYFKRKADGYRQRFFRG